MSNNTSVVETITPTVEELLAQVKEQNREIRAFKKNAAKIAVQTGRRHGREGQVRKMLKDMDLPLPADGSFTGDLVVVFKNVRMIPDGGATVSADDARRLVVDGEMARDFVEVSYSMEFIGYLAGRYGFTMDRGSVVVEIRGWENFDLPSDDDEEE